MVFVKYNAAMDNTTQKPKFNFKKALILLTLIGLLAFLIWFYLIADFSKQKDVRNIKIVENGQYSVSCQPNKYTFIMFPSDEFVETYLVLDRQKWNIEQLNKYSSVLGSLLPFAANNTSLIEILPKEQSGSTRLMIKTNKNTYYIKCIIDPENYKQKVIFKK